MNEKKCNESEQEGAQSATEDALSDVGTREGECQRCGGRDILLRSHSLWMCVRCTRRVAEAARDVKAGSGDMLPFGHVPDHWHCVRCGMAQPGVESMRTLRRGASIRHGPWKFAGTCRLCLGVERAAREAQSAEDHP